MTSLLLPLRPKASSANVRKPLLVPEVYTPCFGSLFQGDHLGVEFALEQVLQHYGALRPELQLLNRRAPPLGRTVQALVIDDFVCVRAVPTSPALPEPCLAEELYEAAQVAYQAEAIEGSPEKDVVGESLLQGIGTEVD